MNDPRYQVIRVYNIDINITFLVLFNATTIMSCVQDFDNN